jgi:hypothetical protein
MDKIMNYAHWQERIPAAIRNDSVWKMAAYRLALFAGDLAWFDVTKLGKDRRTGSLSDQLYRAAGSISANLTEGYSRGTGKDRARFYEYALGSARETRDWYFKGRYVLGPAVSDHRFDLLAEIIRLTLTMIPQQRGYTLKDDEAPYLTTSSARKSPDVESLLTDVPVPPDDAATHQRQSGEL